MLTPQLICFPTPSSANKFNPLPCLGYRYKGLDSSLQKNLSWYSLGCKVSLLLSFCIFLGSKGDSSPSSNPTLAPPHLLPPSPKGITWIHLTFSISAGPKSTHNPHMSTILPSPVLCSQIAYFLQVDNADSVPLTFFLESLLHNRCYLKKREKHVYPFGNLPQINQFAIVNIQALYIC